MTVESWKSEFYAVDAYRSKGENWSDKECLEHALKKWCGLTKENLDKHEVKHDQGMLFHKMKYDADALPIDSSTCAMCEKYYIGGCHGCPVVRHYGDRCCGKVNQYWEFIDKNNPKPMIDLLEFCLKTENE